MNKSRLYLRLYLMREWQIMTLLFWIYFTTQSTPIIAQIFAVSRLHIILWTYFPINIRSLRCDLTFNIVICYFRGNGCIWYLLTLSVTYGIGFKVSWDYLTALYCVSVVFILFIIYLFSKQHLHHFIFIHT